MGGRVRPVHPPKLKEWNLKMMGFPSLGSMLNLRVGGGDFIGNTLEGKGERGSKVFHERILLDGGLVNIINTA